MSDMVRAGERTPARAGNSNWLALAQTGSTNPMLLIPADLRPAVSRLWMCNAHLLPSALALCSTIRVYVDELPLTANDFERIVSRLLTPERRATHRFASDLLTDIATLTAEAVKAKQNAEQLAELRDSVAAVAGGVRLSDLFQKPE